MSVIVIETISTKLVRLEFPYLGEVKPTDHCRLCGRPFDHESDIEIGAGYTEGDKIVLLFDEEHYELIKLKFNENVTLEEERKEQEKEDLDGEYPKS